MAQVNLYHSNSLIPETFTGVNRAELVIDGVTYELLPTGDGGLEVLVANKKIISMPRTDFNNNGRDGRLGIVAVNRD